MQEETIDARAGSSTEPSTEPSAANPLAEQVYQRLKTDIFSFRLFPGDRFSENGIAQYYGVSRTPMRDGLFRLQREGYLEVGFRRGWKVATDRLRPDGSALRSAHRAGSRGARTAGIGRRSGA